MKPYKNLSGDSSIKAFQIYGDGIKIQFEDGSVYLYLYDKIGQEPVDRLKTLAAYGKGLDAFVRSIGRDIGEKLE